MDSAHNAMLIFVSPKNAGIRIVKPRQHSASHASSRRFGGSGHVQVQVCGPSIHDHRLGRLHCRWAHAHRSLPLEARRPMHHQSRQRQPPVVPTRPPSVTGGRQHHWARRPVPTAPNGHAFAGYRVLHRSDSEVLGKQYLAQPHDSEWENVASSNETGEPNSAVGPTRDRIVGTCRHVETAARRRLMGLSRLTDDASGGAPTATRSTARRRFSSFARPSAFTYSQSFWSCLRQVSKSQRDHDARQEIRDQ